MYQAGAATCKVLLIFEQSDGSNLNCVFYRMILGDLGRRQANAFQIRNPEKR